MIIITTTQTSRKAIDRLASQLLRTSDVKESDIAFLTYDNQIMDIPEVDDTLYAPEAKRSPYASIDASLMEKIYEAEEAIDTHRLVAGEIFVAQQRRIDGSNYLRYDKEANAIYIICGFEGFSEEKAEMGSQYESHDLTRKLRDFQDNIRVGTTYFQEHADYVSKNIGPSFNTAMKDVMMAAEKKKPLTEIIGGYNTVSQ